MYTTCGSIADFYLSRFFIPFVEEGCSIVMLVTLKFSYRLSVLVGEL